MADREVEFAKLFEITDACFVKRVVAPEQIRLAHVALSETVKDRFSDALRAIADGVDNRLTPSRKLVRVRPVLERELAARGDDAAVRRDLERLGHRRIQLRGLSFMTLEAGFAADVANALRVQVRTPIGENVFPLSIAEGAQEKADNANAGNPI